MMRPDVSAGSVARPRRVVAAVAAGLGAVTAVVARAADLPSWEGVLAERTNAVPDWVADSLAPVMQLGTTWAAIGIGYLIWLVRKDVQRGFALIVAAFLTRFVSGQLKQIVDRERPGEFRSLDIEIRDTTADGLGWPSSHAAIAAVAATIAYRALPRRWRPIVVGVAVAVGIARLVHGVHFAGDVIGGWSLGVVIGVATLELLAPLERRAAARSSEPGLE